MPRLSFWIVITLALTLAVGLLAPHQLGVTLYKISLVSLAAVLGYWIDRSVFPYARPHYPLMIPQAEKDEPSPYVHPHHTPEGCQYDEVATLRRAILMAAVIIAIALGA